MLFTLREYTVTKGCSGEAEPDKVTHVWFQIKSVSEAQKIILKRCFRRIRNGYSYNWYNYERRGAYDVWNDFDNHSLFHDYMNENMRYRYEFDNLIGPETEKIFIITEEV
jgi:hypothetical protein